MENESPVPGPRKPVLAQPGNPGAEDASGGAAYLEAAQRLARTGSWAWDPAGGGYLHWSREQYRLHGFDPAGGIPSWDEVHRRIHPIDRQRCLQEMEKAVRDGSGWESDYRYVLPDGSIRWLRTRAERLPGTASAFAGADTDVTGSKRIEETLRESEARFRTLVDHAADAIFLHDNADQGRILDVNRQACESLGYNREELIGRTAMMFDAWLTPAQLGGIAQRIIAGEVLAFETRHRRKDGTEFPVEIHIRPFLHGDRPMGLSLARDISERKRAERALGESLDLLRAVVEGTPDAVTVKDMQGRYRMLNSAAARLMGVEAGEAIGKSDAELFGPGAAGESQEREHSILEEGGTGTYEETVRTPAGPRVYLTTKGPYRDRQGNVIGLIGIARDVTEMKRLEGQLRQAQKMEALGRLAGGVAHDFNNLLMIVTGYSELVFNRMRLEDPSRGPMAEIQKAAERATGLTRQLLAFSRKQVLQPRVIGLNPLLRDSCDMLRRLIGENIQLDCALDPGLGLAKVDPGQFEHAIINLAVNGRDAMPGSGRLTLETRNGRIDPEDAERHPEARPGEYVVVTVSDTGHGMEESIKARIFEPFFTTKETAAGPSGRTGTGLGLSMVYGFVKQSGGHIEVESAPGRGTTFRLFLPRTEEAGTVAPAAREEFRVPKGDETVLLVEDEEAVRTLIKMVLQSYGYTVLEARDGQEGLWVAGNHPGAIHALVTDMVMPRMGGRQLADGMLASRPDLRVLFMSGYTDDAILQRGDSDPGTAYVPKPISPLALARRLRRILDAGRRTEE